MKRERSAFVLIAVCALGLVAVAVWVLRPSERTERIPYVEVLDAQVVIADYSLKHMIPGWSDDRGSFARSLCTVGDVDGDGVADVAIGASLAGSRWRGNAILCFMRADGSVDRVQEILRDEALDMWGVIDHIKFGTSVAPIGDLNLDGVPDLFVGGLGWAPADEGYIHAGRCWTVFLGADGRAVDCVALDGEFGWPGSSAYAHVGCAVACLGDITGDGLPEVAVGAEGALAWEPLGRPGTTGGVWLLSLRRDGSVSHASLINGAEVLPTEPPGSVRLFGSSVASIGDLDGNGVTDIVVGCRRYPDVASGGAVVVLLLEDDLTVRRVIVIDNEQAEAAAAATRLGYFPMIAGQFGPCGPFDRSTLVFSGVRGELWFMGLTNGRGNNPRATSSVGGLDLTFQRLDPNRQLPKPGTQDSDNFGGFGRAVAWWPAAGSASGGRLLVGSSELWSIRLADG